MTLSFYTIIWTLSREDIKIIKCGLTIPNDVESYKEFVIKINKNEKIFIEKLTK